jgi:hypothetical protein
LHALDRAGAVTARFISKARALWPLALSFVVAPAAAAKPDPRGESNIPAAEREFAPGAPKGTSSAAPNVVEASSSTNDLPLPYEAWPGPGPQPPTAPPHADLPPPLARARPIPRRPFEMSVALAAFLPSCGSGSVDDRGCLTVARGPGIEATLLYRVGPFFAIGAEGAVSGFGGPEGGALSRAGGSARFLGVVGRLYFAEQGVWDPYVALTLGAGALRLAGGANTHVSTSGLGARVAGGVDFALGSHVRLGPSASFAHWLAWSEERCSGGVCRDERAPYGRLLGFATLGFRVTGSFGDAL